MRRIVRLLLPLCAILVLALSAHAQDKSSRSKKVDRGQGQNVAVIIVKSAAKLGWVVTKAVVKDVAVPITRAVLLKAAPRLTEYAVKRVGPVIVKHATPILIKLALL